MEPSIGSRMREWRVHLGLTQDQMAATLGMSAGVLRKYETGLNVPGGEALSAFATSGVNMNWLLTGKGLMSEAQRQEEVSREIEKAKQGEAVASLLARNDDLSQRWLRIFEMARELPPEEVQRYLDAMVDRLHQDLRYHRLLAEVEAGRKGAPPKD